jgi:hypothetical protein
MMIELETRKRELVDELATLGGAIRGGIVHSKRKCGNKNCECQRKKSRMHPFRYLSTALGVGKKKVVYVKESEIAAFTDAIGQYKRIKEIIEELSAINTTLIKEGK